MPQHLYRQPAFGHTHSTVVQLAPSDMQNTATPGHVQHPSTVTGRLEVLRPRIQGINGL
jgi:hypothetical protein